ncbi:hypothetical protein [Segatella sp.]
MVIQALNYHLAFISCMNYVVLAFIESDILAYLGIVMFILWSKAEATYY